MSYTLCTFQADSHQKKMRRFDSSLDGYYWPNHRKSHGFLTMGKGWQKLFLGIQNSSAICGKSEAMFCKLKECDFISALEPFDIESEIIFFLIFPIETQWIVEGKVKVD